MRDNLYPAGELKESGVCLAEMDPNYIDQLLNNIHFSSLIHQHPAASTFNFHEKYLFIHHQHQDISNNNGDHVGMKRKQADSSSSQNGIPTKNVQDASSGRGKREAKAKEVVHVRAKRGQATHNHSLAERVRREKINEKLRCLQHIVPGCSYKTMGMAVMLDEIINYVQSLQNQVEFLSMKLRAASWFHDFNSDEMPWR